MAQPVVLAIAPDTDPPTLTADALEAIGSSLSVRRADSEAEAVAACGREPVDCVVADTAAIADPQQFVAALRFRCPAVPVVWLSDRPVAAVADTLEAGLTDYVYTVDADLATLVAHRIRSLVGDQQAPSVDGATRVDGDACLDHDASVGRDTDSEADTDAVVTALYGAARDLSAARSEGEIADIGVEAAASALGFEDAIVFSYDEAANVFRPLAHTPGAECNFPGLPPIDATTTSISGRAFFESEPIATTDMSELPEVSNPETPYRRAVFTPIGEHGVLFVGDTEVGTTADRTLTVAKLLGASLAAAFGRLAAEQESAAHRAALADRTAELDAISRTNELVDDLVDELLAASTREAVDTAVCAVLMSVDQYRLAWIGADEGRTDAIVPRAAAGHDEGYIDWLTDRVATREQSALDEPAVRALETNAPVSVDRIARDWQTAPWRKEALSRGYQSAFSVPLTYDGISYGVLSIYADSQDGFDAYTRAVLAEFGRIIAYVIESAETKRGLLADHRTEIELDVEDGADPLHELAGRLGTMLRFEGLVPQRDGHSLLYFRASDSSVDAVETAAAEIGALDSLRVVTRQPEATLFEARVSGPLLAATLVDCGAIPIRIATDGSRHEVAVTIPQTTDARTVLGRIKAAYPSTTVVSRRDRDREIQTQETFRMELLDRLTARQQETLRAAYFAHYFESPRGSTGTELGASLGISQPTFNYHLRAALKTLLTTLFEAEADEPLDN